VEGISQIAFLIVYVGRPLESVTFHAQFRAIA
jgi:hypothetical protein